MKPSNVHNYQVLQLCDVKYVSVVISYTPHSSLLLLEF